MGAANGRTYAVRSEPTRACAGACAPGAWARAGAARAWAALVALVLVIGLWSGLLAGCSRGQGAGDRAGESYRPEKFRLGVFAGEDASERLQKYAPFREYLARELGMEVEQFIGSDYVAVVEAMRAKKVDAMYVGPFAYVLAAQEANAEAITAGVDAKGRTYYQSVILTRAGSGIESMEDLKAKASQLTFAFVDPASTSGHLFPRMVLIKNGIDPDKDFKETIFAGSHEASFLAVLNGRVDAGATYDRNMENLINEGVAKAEDIRVLAISDPIPNTPFAVRRDLDPELKEKVRQALLNAPEDMIKASLGSVQRAVTDKDYDVIREAAKILKLDLRSMK